MRLDEWTGGTIHHLTPEVSLMSWGDRIEFLHRTGSTIAGDPNELRNGFFIELVERMRAITRIIEQSSQLPAEFEGGERLQKAHWALIEGLRRLRDEAMKAAKSITPHSDDLDPDHIRIMAALSITCRALEESAKATDVFGNIASGVIGQVAAMGWDVAKLSSKDYRPEENAPPIPRPANDIIAPGTWTEAMDPDRLPAATKKSPNKRTLMSEAVAAILEDSAVALSVIRSLPRAIKGRISRALGTSATTDMPSDPGE